MMTIAIGNSGLSVNQLDILRRKARLENGFYNIIDGQRISSEKMLAVIEPATGEVLAKVPDADRTLLDQAVKSARQAFFSWSKVSYDERKAILNKVLDTIEEHYEEISILLTREVGRTRSTVDWELQSLAGYRQVLNAPSSFQEESNSVVMGHVMKRYVPLGVVGAISPWNFPVALSMCKVIPALLTGNTIVLKPSPFTPLTMLRIADYLRPILPSGVFNIITGGDELGPLMTSHPGFNKIAFTGSTQTGKRVFASASNDLKRITLELGGNDPGIVLPDADPKEVAETLFWSLFHGNGQICMGLKRLFVPESLYPQLADAMVKIAEKVTLGDGLDPQVGIGASQNEPQFKRLQATWEEIKNSGTKVLFRGQIPEGTSGYFFPVTILDNPEVDASFVAQENFGPIRSLLKYKDVEEAVRKANDTEYGLGASVWGQNLEQLEAVAKQLQAGTVWINQHSVLDANVPFSGHKQSGIGVEFGREGLEAYCNVQVIARKQ
jgi:acyl-CoA reductase-like NAD-dependent aldehyde dehydrogenase